MKPNSITCPLFRICILPLLFLLICITNAQLTLKEMLAQQYGGRPPIPPTTEAPFLENAYQALNEPIPMSLDPRYDLQSAAAVTKAVFKIAHDITELLISQNPQSDYQVISPVSISAALSLILLGARGQTHQELLHTFGYDTDGHLSTTPYKIHEEFGLLIEDMLNDLPNENRTRWATSWKHNGNKGYITSSPYEANIQVESNRNGRGPAPQSDGMSEHNIYVANGIFVQNGYSILPDYRSVVSDVYKSQLVSLDFNQHPTESAQFINKWVQRLTRNKITNIVDNSIVADTKIIVANALYFKALWDAAFHDGATTLKPFYPDGLENPSIEVEMMANGGKFPAYYSTEYDCDILGLPYKKKLTTMYIILPRNSNRQKLQYLQQVLTPDKIEQMIQRMEIKSAIILFPKLHLTFSTDLVGILSQLGANTIFDPQTSDLGLISTGAEYSASVVRKRRGTSYKVESSSNPPRFKDYILNKRITKPNTPEKKPLRYRRQAPESYIEQALKHMDSVRYTQGSTNPGLYVGQILHKVDLTINEKGTEGGAATSVTLNRNGVKVILRCETPFMFLIRHDDTKLPIFYGAVFRPQN